MSSRSAPTSSPPWSTSSPPTVTATEAGEELAYVTENTPVAFKITGFDNVGADTLSITGIRRDGGRLLLTGRAEDVVTDATTCRSSRSRAR
ncbi:hypothetical protein [Ilumatobacter sp.]|uniref:hypothetical protein n=1 Tax=Ilumatobacter sp. TaxID=1967498 RepID=UPI003B51B208